jgi:hypothetical protein
MAASSSELDVVVGCISGLCFEQIAPWVGSLDACGFKGRRVVIHLHVDPQIVMELKRRGYETYDASCLHTGWNGILKENSQDAEISVNRFYYIWYFFSQIARPANCRYLMSVDALDVVFQRDPSLWLEQNLRDKRLVVGCESLHYEDGPWNSKTMQQCFGPHVWNSYRRRLIYNAGATAGEFRTMIDLCLQVYLVSPGDRVLYSDQHALNLLLGSAVYEDITCFASSEDACVCQAGTANDSKLLHTVCDRVTCPRLLFDEEYVRTAAGDIFTLVHQYNRRNGK